MSIKDRTWRLRKKKAWVDDLKEMEEKNRDYIGKLQINDLPLPAKNLLKKEDQKLGRKSIC